MEPTPALPSSVEDITKLSISALTVDPEKEVLPKQLLAAIELLYKPAGLTLTSGANRERESKEYGAARFQINGYRVVFRVAKTTPTKIGQFVTLWNRPTKETQPLDSKDLDFVVISVVNNEKLGQLIFPREALIHHQIISHNGKKGKLGFRVYSPSDRPTVKEAVKTQAWQKSHFFSLAPEDLAMSEKRKLLFDRLCAYFRSNLSSGTG